jgi:methyl-accepting chemotaxis protein/ABC-type sugar transport system substrate-binding protein
MGSAVSRGFLWRFVLVAGGILTMLFSIMAILFSLAGAGVPPFLFPLLTLAGIVFCLVIALLAFIVPMTRVEARQKELTGKQIIPLMNGITQIFVGNLTATVPAPGKKGTHKGRWGALTGIGEGIEEMYGVIREGIFDFNGITADPIRRFCFVGDNAFQEGVIAAREAGRLLNGRGQTAVILTKFKDVNHALRTKGYVNTLRDEFPGITVLATAENDYGAGIRQETERIVGDYLDRWPDLDLLYMTEGYSPVTAAQFIAGRTGCKTKIVTYDIWEDNLTGIELGVIEVLLEQNAWRQGYEPLIYLYNYLEHKRKPVFPKITLKPAVVTPANLDRYWSKTEKKRIFSAEEKAGLEEPLPRKSGGTLKLGMVVADDANFWRGVFEGAREAIDKLKGLGVEVIAEPVYDFAAGHTWGAAVHFIPHLERMEKEGFKGIAVSISDPNLVETINSMAERGMTFATFNGEPFNFREIIQAMYDGLSTLIAHSETLASAATESSRSTILINSTMQKIAEGAAVQNQEVEKTDTLMGSLSSLIQEAGAAMRTINEAMREATRQSQEGGKAVGDSARATAELRSSYRRLEEQVGELKEKIDRIGTIVETIEGFAENTNVLAINAAIQAARAGEQGKGFSVVASAVRVLAENSRKAANDIKTIVQDARLSMDEASLQVSAGNESVGNNLTLADKARDALKMVLETSNSAEMTIHSIDKRLASIEQSGLQVKEAMARLQEIIENSSLRVMEISQSTEEMSVQEEDLSRTAGDMLAMARNQEVLLTQLTFSRK